MSETTADTIAELDADAVASIGPLAELQLYANLPEIEEIVGSEFLGAMREVEKIARMDYLPFLRRAYEAYAAEQEAAEVAEAPVTEVAAETETPAVEVETTDRVVAATGTSLYDRLAAARAAAAARPAGDNPFLDRTPDVSATVEQTAPVTESPAQPEPAVTAVAALVADSAEEAAFLEGLDDTASSTSSAGPAPESTALTADTIEVPVPDGREPLLLTEEEIDEIVVDQLANNRQLNGLQTATLRGKGYGSRKLALIGELAVAPVPKADRRDDRPRRDPNAAADLDEVAKIEERRDKAINWRGVDFNAIFDKMGERMVEDLTTPLETGATNAQVARVRRAVDKFHQIRRSS